MFALAAEDRPVLQFNKQVLANWRAPISAALAGSGVGLGLGALFLIAGMSGHAREHVHAQRMAGAAAVGYASAQRPVEGQGLRTALERYATPPVADAAAVAPRFDNDRGAAKVRPRSDLECLTQAIYFEARGESARGQAAVAQVVLNRVKHPAYPNSVCAVVFQGAGRKRGCQFSFACDGSMKRRRESQAWTRARDIATRTLGGAARAEIGSATHFHTTTVSPAWAPQMLRVASVGTHVFYKFSPYRLRRAPAAPPEMEQAMLTSGSLEAGQELRLMPAILEKAVEAALEPASAPPAPVQAKIQAQAKVQAQAQAQAQTKPAAPAGAPPEPSKASDAATLTSPQTAGAGAS